MSALSTHILTPRSLVSSVQQTSLLLRLKWRTVRSVRSKVMLWGGLIFFLFGVFSVSNAGYIIRVIAQDDNATGTAQQVALTYLATFSDGQLGTLGATALGVALLSSIIAPFTGAVSTSLLPHTSLASVRSSNKHRFTDSIVTQFISSIALLQLIALTTISSLLTIQGGRAWGIMLTWSIWPAFIMLSVLSLWVAEYLHRKHGGSIRVIILSVLGGIIGVALLLDPNNGRTVFGLGTYYAGLVQDVDIQYSILEKVIVFGLIGIFMVFLIFAAGTMSSIALSLPDRNATDASLKKRKARQSSPYPELETFFILLSQIWRNTETRRPLIAATLLGATMAFATQGNFTIITTFTVMAPVVVALAWGVNVFGVIGSGTTWLASQPRIFMNMPWIIILTQIAVTLSIFTIIWVPTFVTGRIEAAEIPSIIFAAIATTILVSRSSLSKTINSPFPTNAGVRGEAIVPPATILGYTFKLALWAGQYGVLILAVDNLLIEASLCVVAVLWSVYRTHRLHEKWKKFPTRVKVINQVSKS